MQNKEEANMSYQQGWNNDQGGYGGGGGGGGGYGGGSGGGGGGSYGGSNRKRTRMKDLAIDVNHHFVESLSI